MMPTSWIACSPSAISSATSNAPYYETFREKKMRQTGGTGIDMMQFLMLGSNGDEPWPRSRSRLNVALSSDGLSWFALVELENDFEPTLAQVEGFQDADSDLDLLDRWRGEGHPDRVADAVRQERTECHG